MNILKAIANVYKGNELYLPIRFIVIKEGYFLFKRGSKEKMYANKEFIYAASEIIDSLEDNNKEPELLFTISDIFHYKTISTDFKNNTKTVFSLKENLNNISEEDLKHSVYIVGTFNFYSLDKFKIPLSTIIELI